MYIKEAHAQDVWPISSARYSHDGQPVQIDAPKRDQERCQVAIDFKRNYGITMPMLVDPVSDAFEKAYAPWPLRYYVLMYEGGQVTVRFKAQPKEASYDLSQVRDFLLASQQ